MNSIAKTIMLVLSGFYGILLLAALYAFAMGIGSLFQLGVVLVIGLIGAAVWFTILVRHRRSGVEVNTG